jgi:hypothetical protein
MPLPLNGCALKEKKYHWICYGAKKNGAHMMTCTFFTMEILNFYLVFWFGALFSRMLYFRE